jgi:hypothetical protein
MNRANWHEFLLALETENPRPLPGEGFVIGQRQLAAYFFP